MNKKSSGWTTGPDGRRYPPRTDPGGNANTGSMPTPAQLGELASLINSGDTARATDTLIDDLELAV